MNDNMGNWDIIKEELEGLLEIYYNDSFTKQACDYIRHTEMTSQEVEQMLKEIRNVHLVKT